MCQAEGGRVIRSLNSSLQVGTTFSCSHVDPSSNDETDILAAKRIDALLNRTFIEPLIGMGYPYKELRLLERIEPFIKDGDEKKLAFDMDFIGIQNYTREIVSHSYFTPYLQAKILKANSRDVNRTIMNWEVYPESIYLMLKQFSGYEKVNKIIVTENGAAFHDNIEEGKVNDAHRKEYLQQYLAQVLKAKMEGINVQGYFIWSFTDNFEWAEGYKPRFGIVHVDFASQKRTVKDSGHWYSRFLSESKVKNNLQEDKRNQLSYHL
jgi:beta-glucosidase